MATVRAHAKRRGVSKSGVQQAIDAGRLPRGATPEEADVALDLTAAPSRGKTPRQRVNEAEETYYEARARRERWQADQAELDYRKAAGKLVDAESVRSSAFSTARKARDLLTAIPDRIGAIVAGLDDAEACRKVIAEEIRRVCDELADPK